MIEIISGIAALISVFAILLRGFVAFFKLDLSILKRKKRERELDIFKRVYSLSTEGNEISMSKIEENLSEIMMVLRVEYKEISLKASEVLFFLKVSGSFNFINEYSSYARKFGVVKINNLGNKIIIGSWIKNKAHLGWVLFFLYFLFPVLTVFTMFTMIEYDFFNWYSSNMKSFYFMIAFYFFIFLCVFLFFYFRVLELAFHLAFSFKNVSYSHGEEVD